MSQAPAPLVAVARSVQRPTIFRPGLPSVDPQECVSLAEVAAEVRRLAQGRAVNVTTGRAAYPGYDDFPTLFAYVGDDKAAALYVGGPWRTEADFLAARDELRGRT